MIDYDLISIFFILKVYYESAKVAKQVVINSATAL